MQEDRVENNAANYLKDVNIQRNFPVQQNQSTVYSLEDYLLQNWNIEKVNKIISESVRGLSLATLLITATLTLQRIMPTKKN